MERDDKKKPAFEFWRQYEKSKRRLDSSLKAVSVPVKPRETKSVDRETEYAPLPILH